MKVRAYRKNHRKSKSYFLSGWAHLVAVVGGSIFIALVVTLFISSLSWFELLTIPVAIILANFVEYAFHRWPMHSVINPLKQMYKTHSGKHHRYFTNEYMNVEIEEDINEVFATTFTVTLFTLFIVLPISFLCSWIITLNVGILFFATCMIYYGIYEFIHFVAHLPIDHILLKIPFMKAAKAHHKLHHNTRMMRHWNFNIAMPLCDIVFKTYKKEQTIQHPARFPR